MTKYPLVQDVLSDAMDEVDMTQAEMAERLNYTRPNIITMWKKGRTPLPIPQVGHVAKLLNIDESYLMKVCLHEYHPEMLKAIESTFGESVSEPEKAILEIFRKAVPKGSVKINASTKKIIRKGFKDAADSR